MEIENVVPLFSHAEGDVIGYHPYVLELSGPAAEVLVGPQLCFVVMKRTGGALLAVPASSMSEEACTTAQQAGPDDLFGPSTVMELQGAAMDWNFPLAEPVRSDAMVTALVMDFSKEVVRYLKEVHDVQDGVDLLNTFAEDEGLVPHADSLVAAVLNWLGTPLEVERMAYYSAEEFAQEVEPVVAESKRKARRKAQGGTTPEGAGKGKKKASVATLAETMEKMRATLPMLIEGGGLVEKD